MTFRRRVPTALLGVSALAFMAAGLAEPVAAQMAPAGCVVEVTGYRQLTDDAGSLGPVSVVVTGKRATAIRSALAALVATSTGPDCMENADGFKISFLPHKGGRPTYVAIEEICPTPGIVSISVGGGTTLHFKEDCALRTAVTAILPRGRAEGARRGTSACSL